MELIVDRDSVCMADDCQSHAIRVDVADDATLEQALAAVDALAFHHVHAAGMTTWLVRAGNRGRPLAAIRLHYVAFIAPRHQLVRFVTDAVWPPVLHFEYRNLDNPDDVQAEHLAVTTDRTSVVLNASR